MNQDSNTPITIGWRENIDFPEWNISKLRVKIDTGAKTSAIHVAEIIRLDDNRLRFEIVLKEKPNRKTIWAESDIVRETIVKPSSGKPQHRYVVKTLMSLGGIEKEIEVSLVCRQGMLCRMLLGRTALANDYLVDATHKYLLRPKKKNKTKRK